MKILYFDCVSGISGDMTVAALLDLGVEPGKFIEDLNTLGLTGWNARIGKGRKGALAGTEFRVALESTPQDKERSLPEIEDLIRRSGISDKAKSLSLAAFRHLAQAEGVIHGIPTEQVHFHEVGAVDSIVDIVGAALCLDALAPDRVVVSPIPMARGHIRCRHGLIPLPAPATLELAKGILICRPPAPTIRELATPTGLALVKAMASEFGEMPEGTVVRIGYGLGKAELPWPNVLRSVILETAERHLEQRVLQLEANLDDMSGEALAHALDRILSDGALDAWLTPILMKKGRPAYTLGVLCEPEAGARITESILRETTTLGVRRCLQERTVLPREIVTVKTRFGPIACKIARMEGLPPRIKPEYEDCRRASETARISISIVIEETVIAVRKQFSANAS